MQRVTLFTDIPNEVLIAEILPKLTPEELGNFFGINKKYYGLGSQYHTFWTEVAKTKNIYLGIHDGPLEKKQLAVLYNYMKRDEMFSKTYGDGSIGASTIICSVGILAGICGGISLMVLGSQDTNEIGVRVSGATLLISILLCMSSCIRICYQLCQISKREDNIKILEDVVVADSEEAFVPEEVMPFIQFANKR